MLSVRTGLVVVGCVFVGFVTSAGPALVARAAEPLAGVVGASAVSGDTPAPEPGEAQGRIAELEQRLKELEAERRGAVSDAASRASASRELEAVNAHNRELTEQNRALAAENQALAQSQLFVPRSRPTACAPPPSDDPRAQIRYWAERLRDGDGATRGRLTTEQNAAVQVLLKRERELDPRNPWRELGSDALASAK